MVVRDRKEVRHEYVPWVDRLKLGRTGARIRGSRTTTGLGGLLKGLGRRLARWGHCEAKVAIQELRGSHASRHLSIQDGRRRLKIVLRSCKRHICIYTDWWDVCGFR